VRGNASENSPNASRTLYTAAPFFFAVSRITRSAAAGNSPITTGRRDLMMPAFSAAICSIVLPKNSV
jgi:hypothetical protein